MQLLPCMEGKTIQIKESVLQRIRQALDTAEYSERLKAWVISNEYFEGFLPETIRCYTTRSELVHAVTNEIVRRWA